MNILHKISKRLSIALGGILVRYAMIPVLAPQGFSFGTYPMHAIVDGITIGVLIVIYFLSKPFHTLFASR